MFKKVIQWFRDLMSKLMALKDTPHAIAGGVAIGMFMGFSPLLGLKTVIAVGVAWLFRCNLIAAAIAVSLHDVFIPLWPFLLRIEYDIGYWLMNVPHHLPPKFSFHHTRPTSWLEWTAFLKNEGRYLLLGSVFLSTPAGIISYYVTLGIFRRREARLRARAD